MFQNIDVTNPTDTDVTNPTDTDVTNPTDTVLKFICEG